MRRREGGQTGGRTSLAGCRPCASTGVGCVRRFFMTRSTLIIIAIIIRWGHARGGGRPQLEGLMSCVIVGSSEKEDLCVRISSCVVGGVGGGVLAADGGGAGEAGSVPFGIFFHRCFSNGVLRNVPSPCPPLVRAAQHGEKGRPGGGGRVSQASKQFLFSWPRPPQEHGSKGVLRS